MFLNESELKTILTINKKITNKPVKYFLLLLVSPFILIKGLFCIIYEYSLGKVFISKSIKKDRIKDYEYELGFVVIVKNEGAYIREWIDYHLTVCDGKTIFYIYDNDSEDNLKSIIGDYIDRGIVKYFFYPGKAKQLSAYEEAIAKYGDECRYMAFIDADEFIYPVQGDNIISEITAIFKKNKYAVGLGINWAIYGSSGREKKTEGLVTERFLKRAEDDFWGNEHIKSICNPRFVKDFISPHYPIYKLGGISVNPKGSRQLLWYISPVDFDTIRLNHYFGKSKEEYIVKRARGWADYENGFYDGFERFNAYDRNEIYDDSVLRFTKRIKNEK